MVESTLAFQEGSTTADKVELQFIEHKSKAQRYNLIIGRINGEATPLALGLDQAARAPLCPASGFLLFPGEGHLLGETALTTAFPCSV